MSVIIHGDSYFRILINHILDWLRWQIGITLISDWLRCFFISHLVFILAHF